LISSGEAFWSTKLEGESYLMNGEALLCYIRERMQYGGVERDRRAQEVLLAIKDHWLVDQPLDTIVRLLPFTLERVSVDLPLADIVGLIEIARAAFAEDVNIRKVTLLYDQEVIPYTTENGAWVFKPLVDLEGWMECLLDGHSTEACALAERLDADD
jgi:anionic cell wall polymer biosynthesis LytR-Cps2A-Psr (LCP) family protein